MSLGEKLREAREAKGLSLEEVTKATKIRSKYLRALEEENFDLLPGRVYAKAFLRTYARFLGLDEIQLAQEFDSICPPPAESGHQPPARLLEEEEPVSLKGLRTILVVLLAIVLLFGINQAYQRLKGSAPERPPQVEEVQKPLAKTTETPPPTTESQPSATSKSITLKLSVTNDRCWMRVVTDGMVAFEGELQAGQEKSFRANHTIQLRLGNAGAVAVSLNGKDLGYLGKPGEVVTRQFSVQEGGSG
ncbi:transcriptional regulator, putative [Ammonifex degensii KC4]|uniref:Transcriptional regulator, putative n=1 Tax=Ammonifex degensii (strain DSM 10501 / KC4) TaxID=429009 RepID=C9R9P3_AMMDK|nr:helix-turn-helix domain-containing protein [Ammonifex degensii]ACX53022.1 transcriptional regulator, putative [Ammonifex degensii KC4]